MGIMNNLIKAFTISNTDNNDIFANAPNMEPDLQKSERVQDSKSIVEDPLSIVQSLGYKDKPQSLSYDTLKQMSVRNSVVASIVATRVNQISSFSQPARFTKDGVGFEISLRNPKVQPTKEQERMILSIEQFLENCGYDYDPYRDNFDTFLRKTVRDSLTFDQMCFELVPDRLGRPSQMYAVDASTIRAASVQPEPGDHYVTNTTDVGSIRWVQILNNEVVAEYTGEELCFGVRNPRTDINIQPYGFSELEVLVHQITAHLWAEEYNSRYFSQGGTTKGILNLKGQNISKPQLESFRRQWISQIAGMTGAWKTPVVSVDGLEYINVSQSNREMEYELWMNYLINICCAVYQIDPAEINFPNRGGSGGSGGGGLGDGGIEDRLKNSKDKGLRPLLRFLESIINRHIIHRFSPEYSFNFVGLDPQSEDEKQATEEKEVRTFRTVNEVRKSKDLPDIEGGDIILDPTYTNYILQAQQQQQMEEMEGQVEGGEDTPPSEDGVAWEGQEEIDPEELQRQNEDEQITQSMDEHYNS